MELPNLDDFEQPKGKRFSKKTPSSSDSADWGGKKGNALSDLKQVGVPSEAEVDAETQRGEKRRFILSAVAIVIVGVLISAGLIYWVNLEDETATVPLSEADKSQVATISSDFIDVAGNFGLRDGVVNDHNALEITSTVMRATANSSDYWLGRWAAYEEVRKNYLTSGPLMYSPQSSGSWFESEEIDKLASWRSTVDKVVVEGRGGGLVDGELVEPTATAVANVRTTVNTWMKTAHDVTWDGKFINNQKSIEHQITLGLVKRGDTWKVRTVNSDRPWVLATGGDPSKFSASYFDDMLGEPTGKVSQEKQ